MVALDPGVRTFQTCYSLDGTVTKLGPGDLEKIHRLCLKLDQLSSHMADKTVTFNHKRRKGMKRKAEWTCFHIWNLVDDAHHHMVRWLCKHNDIILLPCFETAWMAKKEGEDVRHRSEDHTPDVRLGTLSLLGVPLPQGEGVSWMQGGGRQRGLHQPDVWLVQPPQRRRLEQGLRLSRR